jgi:NAD+ synthase (glutamine-hydrolysing)
MSVIVALAQINVTVGDLAGNVRKIIAYGKAAHAAGAKLLITPELSLCGYPPEDLLLRPAFMQACAEALTEIARELGDCSDLHVVVGHPHQRTDPADLLQARVAELPSLR